MTMARFTIVIQIRFSNAFSTKIHQFRVFCNACYLSTVTGEQISISFIVSSRISIWSLSTVRSATASPSHQSTHPTTHWLVFPPYNQHRLCSCTTSAVIHRYFLRLRGVFFFVEPSRQTGAKLLSLVFSYSRVKAFCTASVPIWPPVTDGAHSAPSNKRFSPIDVLYNMYLDGPFAYIVNPRCYTDVLMAVFEQGVAPENFKSETHINKKYVGRGENIF